MAWQSRVYPLQELHLSEMSRVPEDLTSLGLGTTETGYQPQAVTWSPDTDKQAGSALSLWACPNNQNDNHYLRNEMI